MIFVYGGAYQGKRQFVEESYSFDPKEYCICSPEVPPNFDQPVWVGYEQWVLGQIRRQENPVDWLKEHFYALSDKVIIMEDMSCGVVPIESEQRLWLRAVGGCAYLLSTQSKETYRLFCGIPSKLK